MRFGSWPAARIAVAIGEPRAVHPLGDQHVAAGQLPEHRGHAEIALVGDVLRHLGIGGGLEPQIHLERHAALQDLDDRERPQAARLRRVALDEMRAGIKGLEVAGEALPDARPQHLDRHHLARPRPRTTALCTCAIEAAATGSEKLSNSVSTGLPRLASTMARASSVGNGGRSSFSALSAVGHLRADDVGARGQELPELDVGRARAGARASEMRRPRSACRQPARLDQPRQAERSLHRRRQIVERDHAEGAGASEHEARAGKAQQVPHLELPGRMKRRDAARKIPVGHAVEAGRADQVGEALLVRKGADRFHEVAIGVLVAGNGAPDRRNGREGIARRRADRASARRPRRTPGRGNGRRASARAAPPHSACSSAGTLRMPKAIV